MIRAAFSPFPTTFYSASSVFRLRRSVLVVTPGYFIGTSTRLKDSARKMGYSESQAGLEGNQGLQDDDQMIRTLESNIPEAAKASDSLSVTRMARNTKFLSLFTPILLSYRKTKNTTTTLRKKLKATNPDEYYARKTKVLDAQHKHAAPMVKKLLEQMGGLYNKAAQDFVTRGIIVPKPVVDELQSVFEDLPPRKWKHIESIIAKTLGHGKKKVGLERMSKEIDIEREPIASASIGQVHFATLKKNNQKVVVKVLYPEIRKNMSADLSNLRQAVHMIAKLVDAAQMKDAIETLAMELYDNFPRELNLEIEAAHMEFARELLRRHSPDIVVPRSFPEFSSSEILTLSCVPGSTFNRIAQGGEMTQIKAARRALDVVFEAMGNMIFHDGFFHADPHPGNLMLLPDGKPGIIDWGQCMRLTRPQRRRLCQMAILLRTRCMDLISAGLQAGGFSFSTEEAGSQAALIFFFFDSQIDSPFKDDMEKFRKAVQYSPSKMPYFKDVPPEVVFFGRVMTCLRKNCELLGVDISALERWAPIARRELRMIVFEEKPVPRGISSVATGEHEKDEDDSSVWSPSRIALMMKPSTEAFELLQNSMAWVQSNPAIGDAVIDWAVENADLVEKGGSWILSNSNLVSALVDWVQNNHGLCIKGLYFLAKVPSWALVSIVVVFMVLAIVGGCSIVYSIQQLLF